MIGLIVVSHGNFAKEIVFAMEQVVGEQSRISTICIGANDNMELRRKEIHDCAISLDDGDGVIICVDLFGGTPSNLAISLMQIGRVEVIAGVNLPMMIRLSRARQVMNIEDAVQAARDAGRAYITVASEFLGENNEYKEEFKKLSVNQAYNYRDLESLSRDIDLFIEKLEKIKITSSISQFGHNSGANFVTEEHIETIRNGKIAARVASKELQKSKPDLDILKICLKLLSSAWRLIRQISGWVFHKVDRFVDEATKSSGKAIGPSIGIATAATALSGKMTEALEFLKQFINII